MDRSSNYDVVVVGGGPVGSVAAVSAARTGAKVLVLEANPDAARRFAGEWIHPTGVSVLDRLRIGRLESAKARAGYGFVVFPDDGSDPIELAYPANHVSLACEHGAMVEAIREQASALPEITFLSHARVLGLDDHTVAYRVNGRDTSVHAGRIIGADGRSSLARKALGFAPHSTALSYMASVELRDVELPAEGYGHVVLGGPGPVLLYRVAGDLIRGCFDVPLSFDASRRNPTFLWDAFGAVLPERLRESFRRALERGPVQWAVNRFAPRAIYGKGATWLSGDAVGHFHPLTAAGLTLGFLDAERAGQLTSLSDYQREREKGSYVPELLSNALYQVFSRDDASAASIRTAVYRVWRKSRGERERTMRILMGAESRRSSFGAAFVRVAASALTGTVAELTQAKRYGDIIGALSTYREWMQWPAASLAPSAGRKNYRLKSTSERPLPLLPERLASNDQVRSDSIPPVDVPVRESENTSVSQALALSGDALLTELKRMYERIGRDPDWALLRRGTRLVAAIDAAELGGSMSARMRLARRFMATVGMPRLIDAYASDPHTIRGSDFASFMISLLAPRDQESIARLDEGVRHLLACQHASGGFSPWANLSAEPELFTTQLACRALSLCKERFRDDGAFRYVEALDRARRFVSERQKPDGSWPASELEGSLSNTAYAVRALLACGAQPSSPVLRRATRALCAAQTEDGLWIERSEEQGSAAELTAHIVTALLEARGPHWGVIQRAMPHLVNILVDTLVPETQAGDHPEVSERCAEVVEALALYEGQRLSRPRIDSGEKVEIGDDWSFCRESLYAVSRTFSKPIQMLPGKLEVAVTLGYLLCRVADTVEDHPNVPGPKKDMLFGRLLDVLERGAPPRGFALAFDEIPGDDAELSLARNLPRVMRVFWSLPEPMQAIVSRWVAEMSRGMSLYTHREVGEDGFVALYTPEDLERYCYYVAGTVGHMLTELFALELGEGLSAHQLGELRRHAESFGAGLQLVNILKDVTDDRERRWSFVPRSSCERVGLTIETLTDPDQRKLAHLAVEPLFEIAEKRLSKALNYALTIPPEHKGIRLFCLLPLWMAALTLVHARGHDAMFEVGEEVKISREAVENVITECMLNVADDAALRARYRTLWVRPAKAELQPGV